MADQTVTSSLTRLGQRKQAILIGTVKAWGGQIGCYYLPCLGPLKGLPVGLQPSSEVWDMLPNSRDDSYDHKIKTRQARQNGKACSIFELSKSVITQTLAARLALQEDE